jgi:hypothetical protein
MTASFATGILWSTSAAAEGAVALGAPADVAKEGYAFGYSYNAKTKDDARAKGDGANAELKALGITP